ncbi:hypothetical protein K1719_031557 [Acacia pycnantha]|nr:hypothetical protein K1719_031557 [Acacia pycnantha]
MCSTSPHDLLFHSNLKIVSNIGDIPSTPSKFKSDKSPCTHRLRIYPTLSKLTTLWSSFFLIFVLFFVFLSCSSSPAAAPNRHALGDSWGGPDWEKRVNESGVEALLLVSLCLLLVRLVLSAPTCLCVDEAAW